MFPVFRTKREPVIQEIQTESSVAERETEICSGSQPLTRLCTRGSESGRSTAWPRNAPSRSGTVTGSNGPSSVVGIPSPPAAVPKTSSETATVSRSQSSPPLPIPSALPSKVDSPILLGFWRDIYRMWK